MQNNIPAQTAQETVTIPLELANRIMDALYYGGEFIANTGAIIDTICDNMAARRDTARLATVIQTLVPHAENLESFDLSSELAGYIQNCPRPRALTIQTARASCIRSKRITH